MVGQALGFIAQGDMGVDMRPGHRDIQGFLDKIDAAVAQGLKFVIGLGMGGDENHRGVGQLGIGLQRLADLEAVHAGHLDIEQDHIGTALACDSQRFFPTGGDMHLGQIPHRLAENHRVGRLVVDDQDDWSGAKCGLAHSLLPGNSFVIHDQRALTWRRSSPPGQPSVVQGVESECRRLLVIADARHIATPSKLLRRLVGRTVGRSAQRESPSNPSSCARATAWVRRSTPNLLLIWLAWVFTVCREMNNWSLISWFEQPWAIKCRTASSRVLRLSTGCDSSPASRTVWAGSSASRLCRSGVSGPCNSCSRIHSGCAFTRAWNGNSAPPVVASTAWANSGRASASRAVASNTSTHWFQAITLSNWPPLA